MLEGIFDNNQNIKWHLIIILVAKWFKMNKEFRVVYILVSIVPLIVLFFLYSSLSTFVNTKIFGDNGMVVSKPNFILIIIALSFVWYFLSGLFSKKISPLISGVNQSVIRVLINSFLSVLSILLIVSNL